MGREGGGEGQTATHPTHMSTCVDMHRMHDTQGDAGGVQAGMQQRHQELSEN